MKSDSRRAALKSAGRGALTSCRGVLQSLNKIIQVPRVLSKRKKKEVKSTLNMFLILNLKLKEDYLKKYTEIGK